MFNYPLVLLSCGEKYIYKELVINLSIFNKQQLEVRIYWTASLAL